MTKLVSKSLSKSTIQRAYNRYCISSHGDEAGHDPGGLWSTRNSHDSIGQYIGLHDNTTTQRYFQPRYRLETRFTLLMKVKKKCNTLASTTVFCREKKFRAEIQATTDDFNNGR